MADLFFDTQVSDIWASMALMGYSARFDARGRPRQWSTFFFVHIFGLNRDMGNGWFS